MNDNLFTDLDLYKKYIEGMTPEEMIRKGTIAHCKEMEKLDVYEWCASNEVEVYRLKLKLEHLQSLIDKTTNYYLKTLAKNGSMPEEAVKMFNLLEENIK